MKLKIKQLNDKVLDMSAGVLQYPNIMMHNASLLNSVYTTMVSSGVGGHHLTGAVDAVLYQGGNFDYQWNMMWIDSIIHGK